MQVANALNNVIRILFNPKMESFKLFDFLMVKSREERYIAQIIEIYEDKFDASQNVAKLKLFYKINEQDEVIPYDNFTPSKECEVTKVKPEEVEEFINRDEETFVFATNTKNSAPLNLQYNFFNNNALIVADKVENSNNITLNLAKNLSEKKHVILIDSTGAIEHQGAQVLTACKDFKIPLNYTTIDYIFEKCLEDASLEFQSVVGSISNEIKKFAHAQKEQFIPFSAFLKVLLEQYKATPYPELKVLVSRLKKYQIDEMFATTKKDKETLSKATEKSNITIINLSGLKNFWQRAYLEYIASDIEGDVYLIARINEENSDVDLINKIYTQKKNITFIPSASYNYKKLPTIAQYCKNYILMPSLYQRNDFLDANFALANLISEGCIIFGENTDNFLYIASDYELEAQKRRKSYRKIALTIMEDENKIPRVENTQQKISHSQKLIEELEDFDKERNKQTIQESDFEEIEEPQIKEQEEFTSIEEKKEPDYFVEDNTKASEDEFQLIEEQTPQVVLEEDSFEEIEEEKPTANVEKIENDEIEFTPKEDTPKEDASMGFSEEELDFFTQNDSNDLDLSEMANSSIDESFEQIINEQAPKEPKEQDTIEEIIEPKENLPIFKEEASGSATPAYTVGNIVQHSKYGRGTIVKTIKYEERQLLQIEFEESGKKLLDPKVADIKLEQ